MWKKLLLIILITAFSSFAESYINIYSIQVISTKDIKEAKNVYKKISKYPYARIEKIGSYYVVRVGNTRFTKELKPLLKEIKKYYKDSFIRIADIIPERIILANFKFKKEKVKSMIKEKKPDNQEKIKTKKEEKLKFVQNVNSSLVESYINIYSIQVISTKDIKEAKNVYKKISKYPYARIEKIGSYYVVRVGNTRFTKELKPLLKEIKKYYKDSFIRIADIIPERIILANFKFKKEKVKSMIKEKKPDNQEKIKTKKEEKFKIVKDTKDILSLIPDINIKNKTVKIEKTEKQKIKIQQDKVLNIEINEIDKDGINKTLKKYKDTLPYRDKVYAEDIVGRVNEALNTSYRNLKRSKEDYLAYKQFVDLYTKYSNRFKSHINYEYFEDVSRFYLKYQLKKYLWLNSYLYIDNENYFTNSYKKSNYKKLPSIDSLLTIGIKKIFNSSDIIIKLGARKSVELFPILSIDYNFKTNKYWDSTLSLGINQRAEESNLSFYGASKTNLKYSTTISINSKNVISGSTSINNYYSQDFKEIGNGYYFESRYLHKYRIGYPDFSNYIQLSGGFYNEKSNKTGSINKILITPNTQVLPDNFIEACIGSLFGINYIDSYKKQLRPFVDTNICYNTAYNIGYSLFSGLAGEMFDNDNLSFGVYIGKGFFANPYTIFRLQIYYTRWF